MCVHYKVVEKIGRRPDFPKTALNSANFTEAPKKGKSLRKKMKKSPIRKKSKLRKWGTTPINKVKQRIQKLLTQAVRVRDKGCIFKDKGFGACNGFTAADHIITRQRTLLYADLRNCVCVCTYHHIWWKPSNPTLYTEIVRKKIGEEIYKELHELAKKTTQYTLRDWLAIELNLKREIAKINP